MTLRLVTFGRLALMNGESEQPQPRRRLALFARLAASGRRGVSRDELLAVFWPDRDIESARHSLDQLLYETRRAFGASSTVGTATLRLDPMVVTSDVAEWIAALEASDFAGAVALYGGPFLQGFYLNGAAEFERWVETARGQMAADHRRTLEALATQASEAKRLGDAVAWWRRLATEDRFGSRTALALMRALVDAGDRAGALEFARLHEKIVRAELEAAPDPSVMAFADALREAPPRTSKPALETSPASSREMDYETPTTRTTATQIAPPRSRRVRRYSRPVVVAAGFLVIVAALVIRSRIGATHPASSQPPSTARSSNRTQRHETANVAAHDLFERGRDPRLLRSDSGQRLAIDILQQAVTLDTSYAAAYATLASRCATVAWAQPLPIAERRAMFARAESAARRAVALDDSLADAHTALGYVLSVGYEEAASLAELERATALDPTSSEAQGMLADAYEWVSRPADAVAAAQRAVNTDPLSVTAIAGLGHALYFAHRYDEALAQFRKLMDVQPPLRRLPLFLGTLYDAMGRFPDAIALLRPLAPRDPQYRGLLGYAIARSGQRAEAMRMLTELLNDESAGLAPARAIAEVYAGLGDRERAFVWLERSLGDHSLKNEIMGPMFDELRADPRFDRIRRHLGLADQQIARSSSTEPAKEP